MPDAKLEKRLREALSDTSDAEPRPVASLDLPFKMEKLIITPAMLAALRPAAVLVPVMRRPQGLTVMLTVRSDQLRSHKGQISFPGGRRDDTDASAAANALREAQEEVGLDPKLVEVIGYLDDYPTLTRYRVTPVVGIVSGNPRLDHCADEVAEIFEVPLEFVLERKSFETKLLSREGMNLPFYELNFGKHRIWGATAGMLWSLYKKWAAHGH
jgi:8-oxo-dGTP pyrophosphatase MutT (NUDIX family)